MELVVCLFCFQTLNDLTELYVKHRSSATGDNSCAIKYAMVDLVKYFYNRSQMEDMSAGGVDNAQPSVEKCDVNVPENCHDPVDAHQCGKGAKDFDDGEGSNKHSRKVDSDAQRAEVLEV